MAKKGPMFSSASLLSPKYKLANPMASVGLLSFHNVDTFTLWY